MSTKIIIEELPLSADRSEVFEFFGHLGAVLSIHEGVAGPSSRSWIIEMNNIEEAKGIIDQLDDVLNIRIAA